MQLMSSSVLTSEPKTFQAAGRQMFWGCSYLSVILKV